VIGPALGGVVIALFGTGLCFAFNAVSFVAVLVGLLLMRESDMLPVERAATRPTILRGTREGLGYAWREPRIRAVLLIVLVVSTFGFNFNVLLPVLASGTLHAGPQTFGIVSAFFGAGALVGALMAASLARATRKVLLGGTGLFGLFELALAPQHSLVAACGFLFAIGVAFTTWTANSNAGVQLSAPDHLRGRVVGLYYYAFNGTAPAGGLLAGWLCEVGGTELAFAVAGGATVAATVYGLFQIRDRFRRAGTFPAEPVEAEERELEAA
jgi:sugar phosphate permease